MRALITIFQLFISLGVFAQTAEIYFLRSVLANDNGNYEKAFELMDKAIELDSLNGEYYYYRAYMKSGIGSPNPMIFHFEDSTYNSAIGDLNYARILEGENYLNYVILEARLQMRFGKYKDAELTLERGFNPNATDYDLANFYIVKCQLRVKANEIDAANENLEKALKVDSTSLTVLNSVAYQYMELGDHKQALRLINKILSVSPNDEVAWLNVAFYSLENGHYQKAVDLFSDLIKKDSSVGLSFNNRGEALYHLGEYEKALSDVNQAIKLGPGNSYAFKNRALIYLALGKKELACEDLQSAKKLKYSIIFDDKVINLLIDNCLTTNQKVQIDSISTKN